MRYNVGVRVSIIEAALDEGASLFATSWTGLI